jgi:hypothetical protein
MRFSCQLILPSLKEELSSAVLLLDRFVVHSVSFLVEVEDRLDGERLYIFFSGVILLNIL